MSFMEETVNQSLSIWDSCADTPFIRELKQGTLPLEKFKQYMVQDSIYLKHYARVYGKAIYHSTTLKDIQLYYSILSFVTDDESAIRLSYLKQFGLTDSQIEGIPALPENQNYIDFLLGAADGGDICNILMAVLPCMLSYSYIFRKIASEPDVSKSSYWEFIKGYADDRYADDCALWCRFAQEKCQGLSGAEKKELTAVFKKASELELDFWKMSYGEDTLS